MSVTVPFLHAFIDAFRWYYELLRLPIYLLSSLGFTPCFDILIPVENIQALQGISDVSVLSSPRSRTPVSLHTSRRYNDVFVLPAAERKASALTCHT